MNLTQEQINILTHVLIDPQAWVDNVLSNPKFSEQTILDKIKRHKSIYEQHKNRLDYKNRAQRQAEKDKAFEQERLDFIARRKTLMAAEEQRLKDLVTQEVEKQLNLR